MAITLYTGLVGAGKTYEVLRSVILPALVAGRSVVANIDGLDVERIAAYLEGVGTPSTGELVVVERSDIRRPDFFPARQRDGSYLPSQWVPLGALVIVDEAPTFWGSGATCSPSDLVFFREHRHIVAADGVACDLVVIALTVGSLHRSLSSLVEFSMDVGKLSAVKMSNRYTLITYQGSKRSKATLLGRQTLSYNPKLFPLYKSFAGEGGRIVDTDPRFSIFASRGFWALFAFAVLFLIWAGWHFSHGMLGRRTVASGGATGAGVVAASANQVGYVAPAGAARTARSVAPRPIVSPWRVEGSASFGGSAYAVLQRDGYPLRYLALSLCELTMGEPMVCHDGSMDALPFVPPPPSTAPKAPPSLTAGLFGVKGK